MGRPLSKKYFGNRNLGVAGTLTGADSEIGGQGVASVSVATQGSININDTYKHFPALTASAPTIANGVTATFAVTWEVATVSLSGGTGYQAGTITSINGLDTYGDVKTRFTVTVVGGVPTFGAFTERGSYTSIDGTGISSTWSVNGPLGIGAQATVTFRVKAIAVTTSGDGYVTVPSLSWSAVNGGTMPSGQTPTLTIDSGNIGSATYRENAIIAYAFISGSLVEVDIQKQQSSRRYRVNKSGDTGTYEHVGTRMARLRSTGEADGTAGFTAEEGVELNIVAFDSAGGTYLVRKLTAHKAVVVPTAITRLSSSAGSQFPLVNSIAQTVPWTFGTLTINYNVQIENA
jgi:hypothetical protein